MTATLKIQLPRPHDGQRAILASTKRFNVVACGRRFGKSILGENRICRPALDGYPCGWFAPNFKYLLEAWTDLNRILAPAIVRKDSQQRRIELLTGGVIEFWSMEDPDAGRSRKYKHVIIDEAAKARHLRYAWTHAIRATLADLRGTADLLSTPRGMDFFSECFALGQDPLNPEWAAWQMPTGTNPHIPPEEIEELRRTLPERVYQQEILAQFLEDGGSVFRNVTAAVDKGRTANEPPVAGRSYCLGVDLARVEDFTVLAVVDDDGRQVYFERFNQISWERQIAAIKAVAARYRARGFLDSTGVGDPIFERLRRDGVSLQAYQLTNQSKESLIDNLAVLIEQGRVRLLDEPTQTNELKAYAYELTAARNVRMNAPEGLHDDTVIALALACWGLHRKGRYSFGTPEPAATPDAAKADDWNRIDNEAFWGDA